MVVIVDVEKEAIDVSNPGVMAFPKKQIYFADECFAFADI